MKTLVLCSNASGEPEFHSCNPELDEHLVCQAAIENAQDHGYEGPFIAFTQRDPAGKQLLELSCYLLEEDAAYVAPFGSGVRSALTEVLDDLEDDDVPTARRRILGMLEAMRGGLPKADLALMLEMARSHIDDIEEGLSDGTYLPEDNQLLGEKRRVAEAFDSLLRDDPTETHHLVVVEGDVEPFVIGPFASEEAVMEEARRQRANDPDRQNGLYWLGILDGTPAIGSFPVGLLVPDLHPFVVAFRSNDPEQAPRFRNHYHCTKCDQIWDDTWDSRCDDDCPACGTVMTPYASEDLEVRVEFFACEAEDVEHALEQAANAYPGAEILGAVPTWMHELKLGATVFWNDPNEGQFTGFYVIDVIHTESGKLETPLSRLKLRCDGPPGLITAPARQIEKVKP